MIIRKAKTLSKPNSRRERAFTLLEVIVTLAIMALLSLATVLEVPALLDAFNERNARELFDQDLRRARAEATREGCRVLFQFESGGNIYKVGRDRPPYSSPAAVEEQIMVRNLPKNITVTAGQTVMFDARGYLIDAAGNPSQTSVTFQVNKKNFLTGAIYASGLLHYAK